MSAIPEIVQRFRSLLDESTEEELQVHAYNSPAMHMALYMEIKDKNNKWIRPEPNVLQLRVSEVIETIRERCPGTRIRIIGVKPRRAGLSTFSLFCGYHESQKRPIEGITIADCSDNSEMLTEKLSEFSSHDSFDWENRLIKDVAGEKAWSNGSTWTIDTAENPDAGVGGTRQFGHFSEVAKFPQTRIKNDVKTMTAALPSMDGDDTIGIAESTPERASGWFHNTFVDKAMWLDDFLKRYDEGFRPEEQWIRVFAGWWEFDDYKRKQPVTAAEREEIDATLDKTEQEGIRKYGWDYEQIAWRRDTIKNTCDGQAAIFNYYYPSDPWTCWISGGSPRFDMQRLAEWKIKAHSILPESGYLVRQERDNVSFQPERDGSGDIKIWERPKPGCKYMVSVDPAESISQTIGEDTDAHSLGVWRSGYHDPLLGRWIKPKLVARLIYGFRGEEDDLAAHAIRLSRYYGRAIISQETNKGFHCLRVLQEAGMPLYKRRPISHRTGKVEEQYGFKTDAQNREAIISGMASAIANDDLDILCPDMVEELKHFIRGERRCEAAPGKHDDDVLQACIAWETLPSATLYTKEVHKHQDPVDDKTWKNAARRW